MATSIPAFEYHPEAVFEAARAYHWYSERSEAAADAFWEALRSARLAAATHPMSWSPYLHGTRILKFDRFRYGLVYLERGEVIVGVAVAHLHRRPGYWKNRLKS